MCHADAGRSLLYHGSRRSFCLARSSIVGRGIKGNDRRNVVLHISVYSDSLVGGIADIVVDRCMAAVYDNKGGGKTEYCGETERM